MTEIKRPSAGDLVRYWRRARQISQMELSLDCDTSSRHLSCVETGRAHPSSQLLLRICNALDIPLRARNNILIAAGYASHYQDTGLSDPEMREARTVLERIVSLHQPYPSVLINRSWDIVLYNNSFKLMVEKFCASESVPDSDSWNLLRLLFHPEAWAPNVVNLSSVYATMMARSRRSLVAEGANHALTELLEEIAELRPREHQDWEKGSHNENVQPKLIMPVHYRKNGQEVKLITTAATLGAPLNITLQELQIECAYPADEASEIYFRSI